MQNYRAYVDAYGTPSPWNAFEKCVEECQEYGQIQRTRNSGKGLEDEDIANLKHANLLQNYLAHEVEQGAIEQSKRYFHDITSVIVLGHNLQSDENYLNELFQHLTNLKTVMDFKKRECRTIDSALHKLPLCTILFPPYRQTC